MNHVTVICPTESCRSTFEVSAENMERKVRCKNCGTVFVLNESVSQESPDTQTGDGETVRKSPTQRLGRFEIRSQIGQGGFGVVYYAYDPVLDREVALKVPNAAAVVDPESAQRFLREAKAAAQLRHPHIVPVFDAGVDGGQLYIASAFIKGKSLSQVVKETGPLPLNQAAEIVRKLADALEYAHQQGIVHRDIKPDNVMVDERV